MALQRWGDMVGRRLGERTAHAFVATVASAAREQAPGTGAVERFRQIPWPIKSGLTPIGTAMLFTDNPRPGITIFRATRPQWGNG